MMSFLAADTVGNPAINISIFAAFVVATLFIVIRVSRRNTTDRVLHRRESLLRSAERHRDRR